MVNLLYIYIQRNHIITLYTLTENKICLNEQKVNRINRIANKISVALIEKSIDSTVSVLLNIYKIAVDLRV